MKSPGAGESGVEKTLCRSSRPCLSSVSENPPVIFDGKRNDNPFPDASAAVFAVSPSVFSHPFWGPLIRIAPLRGIVLDR